MNIILILLVLNLNLKWNTVVAVVLVGNAQLSLQVQPKGAEGLVPMRMGTSFPTTHPKSK